MEPESVRRLRGAAELVTESLDAAATALGEAHTATAHGFYDLLGCAERVGLPVYSIGRVQQTITTGVYGSIRVVNRAAGCGLTLLLHRVEKSKKP